jgi:DNA-binding NtrC family response regulator
VSDPLSATSGSIVPPVSLEGTETILLVEDEEQVRSLARVILSRRGYTVIEASNGGEALLVCEQTKTPIHLLLSDVVLPRMSGPELAERLAGLHPEMRRLYMSGYADEWRRLGTSGQPFLPKPFAPTALARKVREVLGG